MAKLEIAVLIGAESKQFLSDLTKQIDRLESLQNSVSPTPTPVEPEPEAMTDAKVETKIENKVEEKPKAKSKKKETKPEPEVVEVEESPKSFDEMFNDAPDALTAPNLDDVRKAVKDFAAKHGKDKGMALLNKFGCNSIPDLKATEYGAVIELAKRYM